ncbi:hypothetical protein H7A76_06375 [Pseudomonas sp. MSSRFD41]|uniref:hypothetical protein n=1 Tax=Pseudomonas sp. MSSRFD41 TaxID=1310370 RepID=UPI0016397DA2|nr:hypothetical protein [Pseudomonas sp. MSSRFD41]MBC2655061.1 hypothetical protein [Pseudomonas sp. MSSRFD41]
MSSIDRVTLILRPSDGGNLESILPFAKLGAHVSIGRGLAVIAGASLGDLQAILEEQQAKPRSTSVDSGTVNQNVNFGENVNQHQDDLEPDLIAIIAALQQKISLMEAPLDIDDRVRMTADARRYRWLRDHAVSTGSGFTPAVFDRAGGIGTARVGEDLDLRIDAAIRSFTQQQAAQGMQEHPL